MSKVAEEYLRHVLDEIKFVLKETKGIDEESFVGNEILKRALARSLEIMGEAVKNLPESFREEHVEVEWKDLAGLRDKLVHHYFGVDYGIVWDVVKNELPELKERIKKLLQG